MSRQFSRLTITSPPSSFSLPRSRRANIRTTLVTTPTTQGAPQPSQGLYISSRPADYNLAAAKALDDHLDVPVLPMPQRLYPIRGLPNSKSRVVQFDNLPSIVPANFKAPAFKVKPFEPKPFRNNWTPGDDAHMHAIPAKIDFQACEADGVPEIGLDVPRYTVPAAVSEELRAYFGFDARPLRGKLNVSNQASVLFTSSIVTPHSFMSSSYGADYQQTRLRSTLATRKANKAAAAVAEATNVKKGHLKQGNTIPKMASAGKFTKEKIDDKRASLRAGSENPTPGGLNGADMSAPESGRIIGGGPLGAMGGPKSGKTLTTPATSHVKNSKGQLRGFTASSSREFRAGSAKVSPKGSETEKLRQKRLMDKDALELVSYEYTISGTDNGVGGDAEAYCREHLHPDEEMAEELMMHSDANPLEYSPANAEMSKAAPERVEGSTKETGKETLKRHSGPGNKKGRKVNLEEKYRLEKYRLEEAARKKVAGDVGL